MAKAIVGLALAAKFAVALSFPYVPTQILMPTACYDQTNCSASNVAYILSQSDSGVDFLQLDYTGKLDADAQPKKINDKLPFLDGKPDSTAFAAVRSATGQVMVYAGECGKANGQLWTYTKDWEQTTTNGAKQDTYRSPSFLGGALAFSGTLAPETDAPTMYTYGGMCSTPGSEDDWQSAGKYTKTMLSIAPDGPETYDVEIASTAGPRSPFAGFSLTPLPPSMTNISDTVSQRASYVLLGGHTQQAFINMSTAAVWNLPQQSWSYINIAQPHMGNTELKTTKRDDIEVTSRSGHSAVLSEDGNSIIVLGGWVGDVHTPAEPQLAVLKMGGTYDSWEWSVPDAKADEKPLFGHGAAILPGNVMMVYGGWEIDGQNQKNKRQAAASSSLRFFNLTSMSWVPSYNSADVPKKNPGAPDAPDAPDASQASKSKSIKLGLGLGLGLGMGLVIIAGCIAVFCCLRSKKRREERSRDSAAQAMAQDAAYFNENDEMLERDDYSAFTAGWYGNQGPQQQQHQQQYMNRSPGYESMMSGAVPPPITRKPVNRPALSNYSAYSPVETRMNAFISTPGEIHPIMEDDDEDDQHRGQHHHDLLTPSSEVNADPFANSNVREYPTISSLSRASATPSPEAGMRRYDPDVQEWASDVDAADAMLARYNHRKGRTSPTRRPSHRSAATRDDESRSGSNLSESTRSQADSLLYRDKGKAVSSSSGSFRTARSGRSGFNTLQAEGPSLLTGNKQHGVEDDEPGSPSKAKPRRGWLGSIKRVFSNSGPPPPQMDVVPSMDEKYDGEGYGGGGDYEPLSGLGGEVLKRKQGRHDWEAGDGKEENEWDVEKAIEQRLVQVMFTVPREKLRVVNGADEDEDEAAATPAQAKGTVPESQTQMKSDTQPPVIPQIKVPGPLLQPDCRRAQTPSPTKHLDVDAVSQVSSGDPFSDDHSKRWSQVSDIDRDVLLRMSRHGDLAEPRFSHSTDHSDPRVFTAEAVRMERAERPKTRVLAMVDNIERSDQESI